MRWAIGSQKKARMTTAALGCLHVGSCHAAKLLLKDGEHVPHSGGESLGVQHADGAATLGNGRGYKMCNHWSWQQRVKNIKKHILHAPMCWEDHLPCRSPTLCMAELSPEGCASPSSRWCSWWRPGSHRTGRPPDGDVQFSRFWLHSRHSWSFSPFWSQWSQITINLHSEWAGWLIGQLVERGRALPWDQIKEVY